MREIVALVYRIYYSVFTNDMTVVFPFNDMFTVDRILE